MREREIVTLELSGSTGPIEGTLQTADEARREFRGWLELTQALEQIRQFAFLDQSAAGGQGVADTGRQR
jgi:hypothetical protein